MRWQVTPENTVRVRREVAAHITALRLPPGEYYTVSKRWEGGCQIVVSPHLPGALNAAREFLA